MGTEGMAKYKEFLSSKKSRIESHGIEISKDKTHPILYPFQKDIVKWALRKGRAAIFLDTGLGKTFIQVEWARLLNCRSIIIAPLSVTRQTIREAQKIDVEIRYIRSMQEMTESVMIYTCNYEMIKEIDFNQFDAVVLDESSILKSISGVIKRYLIKECANVKYRLCCTATPAPNDQTEIGNHAEFLGICSTVEMLAMFFVHANRQDEKVYSNDIVIRKKHSNKEGQEWRLKNHARGPFYEWMAEWAIAMTHPGELGYSNDGYILPKLNIELVLVNSEYVPVGELFHTKLKGIEDRAKVRLATIEDRLETVNALIDDNGGQWIIWAGLQKEADGLKRILDNAREVKGGDSHDYKVDAFEDFQDGKYKILITKGKIAGFGMNFQNASNMIFFGLSDSWESYYQCIRREWRYGQKKEVNVYIVISDIEQAIYHNIMRKERVAKIMIKELLSNITIYEKKELGIENDNRRIEMEYSPSVSGKKYTAIHGDSCRELKTMPDNHIDLSVYSPPFADLYTYTNMSEDLGNCKGWGEFFNHYAYIIKEIYRVTKVGRLTCVHTSDIPALGIKDGYIGIKDFPGEVIRAYTEHGWIFHGRAFIQKNPQAQAIRTHSKALLFAQIRKDSAHSRPALVDQILIFKKPGDCEVPVTPIINKEMDNELWINWAHGIWFGISESDTLRYNDARAADDEKHICPLQLGTIERCIKLYSNPGELILSPFMGIGSEIYQAIRFGRRGIGVELKQSYFEIAVRNLKYAEEYFTENMLIEEEQCSHT